MQHRRDVACALYAAAIVFAAHSAAAQETASPLKEPLSQPLLPPAASAGAPKPDAAPVLLVEEPRVLVHLEPDGFTLETGEGRDWGDVCSAPCDVYVPWEAKYRVRKGLDAAPSRPFVLQRSRMNPAPVRIEVRARSVNHLVGGVVAIVFGSGMDALGVLLLIPAIGGESDWAGLLAGGITLVGAGAALIVLGAYLVADSGLPEPAQTRFVPRAPTSALSPRSPVWREPIVADLSPPVLGARVFRVSF